MWPNSASARAAWGRCSLKIIGRSPIFFDVYPGGKGKSAVSRARAEEEDEEDEREKTTTTTKKKREEDEDDDDDEEEEEEADEEGSWRAGIERPARRLLPVG